MRSSSCVTAVSSRIEIPESWAPGSLQLTHAGGGYVLSYLKVMTYEGARRDGRIIRLDTDGSVLGPAIELDRYESVAGTFDTGESILRVAERQGWTVISMKDDWTTIFADAS